MRTNNNRDKHKGPFRVIEEETGEKLGLYTSNYLILSALMGRLNMQLYKFSEVMCNYVSTTPPKWRKKKVEFIEKYIWDAMDELETSAAKADLGNKEEMDSYSENVTTIVNLIAHSVNQIYDSKLNLFTKSNAITWSIATLNSICQVLGVAGLG